MEMKWIYLIINGVCKYIKERDFFFINVESGVNLLEYIYIYVCVCVCVCVCVRVIKIREKLINPTGLVIFHSLFTELLQTKHFLGFPTFKNCLNAWNYLTGASRLGLENKPSASLQRGKTPPTSVLDLTLNNLMVRFKWWWGFGECRAPLYYHRFKVHWPGVIEPDRVLSMG